MRLLVLSMTKARKCSLSSSLCLRFSLITTSAHHSVRVHCTDSGHQEKVSDGGVNQSSLHLFLTCCCVGWALGPFFSVILAPSESVCLSVSHSLSAPVCFLSPWSQLFGEPLLSLILLTYPSLYLSAFKHHNKHSPSCFGDQNASICLVCLSLVCGFLFFVAVAVVFLT